MIWYQNIAVITESILDCQTDIVITYAQTYNININAGAIAAQDEFAGLIQDTIQRLNRGGDPLTTAGVL